MVIVVAAFGIFLEGTSHSSTVSSSSLSTGTSGAAPFKVLYDNLTVGFQGGLWQLGFQDTGNQSVLKMVAVLFTPVETSMCSGFYSGLLFSNCSSVADAPSSAGPSNKYPNGFPLNYTFTGYATGLSPGSAIVGQNYTVHITALFVGGATINQTSTVEAVNG